MGSRIPPLYGEGIKYWVDELIKAIKLHDEGAIQVCLKTLATFIKNDE